MNKFFNYYSSLCVGSDAPTTFSRDPFVIAVKQILILELQQIVYYIEKLSDLDVDMTTYIDKVIDFIYIIIVNMDFKKENITLIIQDLNKNEKILEKMYVSACEKKNITPELITDSSFDFSSEEKILKILNEYERDLKSFSSHLDKDKKTLYEIIINLVLNACICLMELKNLGVDFTEAKRQVLKLLNTSNIPSLSNDDWIEKIKEFSKCNYKIMVKLYETTIEKYGPMIKSDVSLSIKKGKAILVSGNSFMDLEKILIATKDLNINVYTHFDMISAFQYEKFKEYPNLVGHFLKTENNFPFDFASFSGPIYISANAIPKIDAIRGQIYTSVKYPSYGIAKIENDDFAPLVEYALTSKGFTSDKPAKTIQLGFSENELEQNILNIIEKFKNKEIKNIYIIGLIDQFNKSNEYIKEFLNTVSDDSFIISFSYQIERENFWHVNSFYNFVAVYKIIEKISSSIPDFQKHFAIFLIDCNSRTISHIFNLLYLGVKNIFLGPCCPNIINPVLIDGLKEIFSIEPITKPSDDVLKIEQKKEED